MTLYKKVFYCLLLIILFLPPFFSGGNNIFIQEIIFIFINICFLFFLLSGSKEKLIKSGQSWPYIFLWLYLLTTLTSVLVSTNLYIGAITWVNYLNYAILFLVVSKFIFKKSEIIFLVKAFVFMATILSLIGIYFYLFGDYTRLTSTFYWPNPFAGYLLFAIPLGFYWLFAVERIMLPAVLSSVVLSAFILCDSRGAFLTLAIILIFFVFISRSYFQKKWRYLVLICFFSFVLALGLSLIKSNISYIAEHHGIIGISSDTSTNIKIAYWRGAGEIVKKYPLFGSGPATFATIYSNYQTSPLNSGKYAHNWYLEILAETGPSTLIFFVLFIGSALFLNRRAIKNDLLKIAFALGIIGSVIHNGIDIDWHFAANYIALFFIIGLLVNNSDEERDNTQKIAEVKDLRKKIYLVIGFSVSVLLIAESVVLLFSDYNFQLGQASQTRRDLVTAEKYYQRSLFLNPDPDFIRQHAIILYSLGVITKDKSAPNYTTTALEISKKLIKIDPDNSLNYELNGKIYTQLADYQTAEKSFQRAIELDPYNHPGYYRQLAEVLLFQGKKQEAKEVVGKILSFYPTEVVEVKKMIIMPDQTITSGIEKEIELLKELGGEIQSK